jgi:lipopolysaccharide heptosyltransferase II
VKRILIVKMWALGDVLVATPLLRALKALYPDCSISWLVEQRYAGVVADNPLIDDVISIDWRSWQKDFRYGKVFPYIRTGVEIRQELKRRNFDIEICLTPDKWWCVWFHAAPMRIALFPTNKPGLLARFYTDIILRQPGSTTHHIDRNLQPMQILGDSGPYDRRIVFAVTVQNEQIVKRFLDGLHGFNPEKPYVIFHPGTSQKTKCWPTNNFAVLAALLIGQTQVIVTGSSEDRDLAEQIKGATACEGVFVAAGWLGSIGETAALIKGALGVVTGDTSILHIASALEIPTVAIYGSTRPNEYASLFDKTVTLFDDSLTCSPCYNSACLLVGAEHLQCLTRITPETVYNGLLSLVSFSDLADPSTDFS